MTSFLYQLILGIALSIILSGIGYDIRICYIKASDRVVVLDSKIMLCLNIEMVSCGTSILNCHNSKSPLISILMFGKMVLQGAGMKIYLPIYGGGRYLGARRVQRENIVFCHWLISCKS